ncbi:NADH-quinone oxidoreductase subunit A [bacterium]|nr:NADH-quinone oxidoreductase subunit A [bacterium]
MLAASSLLGPKGYGKTKYEPWECGVDRVQPSARERFAVPFYLVAILFILFDLETVFLFPWAVVMKKVSAQDPAAGAQLLGEVLVFVGVLALGLFYVWKRRGLEWD